jgi:hypothetical protein
MSIQSIKLPVVNKRKRVGYEHLDAEALGANRYRLVLSPGVVEGIAADDVFIFDDDVLEGFRVVERSGNLCVWVFFERREAPWLPKTRELQSSVARLGGRLDGGMKQILVFTIPVSVGFSRVESLFESFVHRVPETEWLFGNVFDRDGRPLGWWH